MHTKNKQIQKYIWVIGINDFNQSIFKLFFFDNVIVNLYNSHLLS